MRCVDDEDVEEEDDNDDRLRDGAFENSGEGAGSEWRRENVFVGVGNEIIGSGVSGG